VSVRYAIQLKCLCNILCLLSLILFAFGCSTMKPNYLECVQARKVDVICETPDTPDICIYKDGSVYWEETATSGSKKDFLIKFGRKTPFERFGVKVKEIYSITTTGKTDEFSPTKSGEYKFTLFCKGKKKDPMIRVP
jgi:hypothetical protein